MGAIVNFRPVVKKEEFTLESGKKIMVYKRDNTATSLMKSLVKRQLEEYLEKEVTI